MSWYLENIKELSKEAPYTFYEPSPEVLNQLQLGDYVKLIFIQEEIKEDEFGGERMWVRITKMENGQFTGELDNEPHYISIKLGDTVLFNTHHICDTEYDDPTASKSALYADTLVTVSSDVFAREEFHFMLRDEPNGEGDSGWSILSGYEDDEFLSDPDNFEIVSLGHILNINDSILSFIDEPALCAYETDEAGDFYKIEDFDWASYLQG